MTRHLVLSLAVVAMIAGHAAPAAAFTRVPVSLASDSARPGPIIPDFGIKQKAKSHPVARAPRTVDPLKLLRNRMVSGKSVSFAELRHLADSGDDLAAYYLGKRIAEAGKPDQLDTAAHYFLRALYRGRNAALRPLIKLVETGAIDGQERLIAEALKLLEQRAGEGDALARDGLISMWRSGTPFGRDPARAEALIVAAARGGDSKAALDLAFLLLAGTPEPAEVAEARDYLQIASLSEALNIRTVAENLLRGLDLAPVIAATEIVQ